jgi:hypothetical protein
MNTNSFKRTSDKRFTNVLWITFAAVIMAFVIMPATASAQSACNVPGNLVVNCGFEAGSFAPWIVAWGSDCCTFVAPGCGHSAAPNYYCAALGAVYGLNTVSQTLNENTPTKYPAGTVFTVSFWLNNLGYCCKNYFEARWNDTTLMVISEATVPTGYTHYSFQVVGTGSTRDTLSFIAENQPSYFDLDDVVVVPGGSPPYLPNRKN